MSDIGVILLFDGQPGATLADAAARAKELEDMGYSSLWVPDHVVTFESYEPRYPYAPDGQPGFSARQGWYDPLWVLAAAAGSTSRIRLGTGVVILPQRNPLLLAKEFVALDHLSGGRVNVGVGVGWSIEEFEALGVPYDRRGERATEYLTAMRKLWTDDLATMDGEFVRFKDVVALPKPRQQPAPPVFIGGQSGPALRRVATHGDGWLSWMVPADGLKSTVESLTTACEQAGRDPETIRKASAFFYSGVDDMNRYIETAQGCGVTEIVAMPWCPDGYPVREIQEIADRIISQQ